MTTERRPEFKNFIDQVLGSERLIYTDYPDDFEMQRQTALEVIEILFEQYKPTDKEISSITKNSILENPLLNWGVKIVDLRQRKARLQIEQRETGNYSGPLVETCGELDLLEKMTENQIFTENKENRVFRPDGYDRRFDAGDRFD